MKARWKVAATLAIACVVLVGFIAVEHLPREISGVVEQAFGYRLKDEVQIVARKYEVPFSFQGVTYWEETTLRLSESDYRNLVARLSSDHSFEKKRFGSNEFHERFVVGKELVTWRTREGAREFWFSYSEY